MQCRKNSPTWTSTRPPTVSATCFLQESKRTPSFPTHQASSGLPVITLTVKAFVQWTASSPQLFICCIGALFAGVSAQAAEIPPAISAQRKNKYQMVNLEKESYLYEDANIIPQNKWGCRMYTTGRDTMDNGFIWIKNSILYMSWRKRSNSGLV